METRTGDSQDNRALTVSTPFGKDKLLLDAFEGEEGISRLFRFTLDMRSSDPKLALDTIVGAAAGVAIVEQSGDTRHFHGIVSRFSYRGFDADYAHYSAELVPRLWLLTLGRDRVIYQNLTARKIITQVLDDNQVIYSDKLGGSYAEREYCVRYDETAFDFICRLMEEEGIFWFFTFAQGSHTLVLADAASAHSACTVTPRLAMVPGGVVGGEIDIGALRRFDLAGQVVVKDQKLSDYAFETPSTQLLASAVGSKGKGADFAWPGGHATVDEGRARAARLVAAQQVQSARGSGDGFSPFLQAGASFTLSGHQRPELNTDHVLAQVSHRARDGGYANSFETFPLATPFRPVRATARPRVMGSNTAKVVGSSGEEIWTDAHGRVKLQFPWDRDGKSDQTSSCWVRVSQSWAGQGWGGFVLPRIGQEVIVSYLDGDPDRPLVTGCVYNGENKPPVTLPAMQTQTVLRSRSSKKGKAGNELRFEDKLDAEELYLHAQKDMKVLVQNDLSTTLNEGAETHTVKKGDRTVAVETGNETHTVAGTRTLEVGGDESRTNKADFLQEVTGKYTLKIDGDLLIDVAGTVVFKSAKSIAIQAGTTLGGKAGTSLVNEAGTSLENKAGTTLTNKAGTNLTNQAGMGLSNKAGTTLANEGLMVNNKASASQTVEGGGMLTLKGGLVKIN